MFLELQIIIRNEKLKLNDYKLIFKGHYHTNCHEYHCDLRIITQILS